MTSADLRRHARQTEQIVATQIAALLRRQERGTGDATERALDRLWAWRERCKTYADGVTDRDERAYLAASRERERERRLGRLDIPTTRLPRWERKGRTGLLTRFELLTVLIVVVALVILAGCLIGTAAVHLIERAML